MIDTTISIVTANVQKLGNLKKRNTLFTHYSKSTKGSLFLLTETNCYQQNANAVWAQEADQCGLGSLFRPNSDAALLWRKTTFQHAPTQQYHVADLMSTHKNRIADGVFTVSSFTVRIISLYAPVYSADRKRFFRSLQFALQNLSKDIPCCIAGDWNCVENPMLDSSNPNGQNDGGEELKSLLAALGYSDAFRLLYPKKFLPSNHHPSTQRRLDRLYISPSLKGLVQSTDQWERYQSTHNPVLLRLQLPDAIPKGQHSFKLGVHHLKREGMGPILTKMLQRHHDEATAQHSDPFIAWDRCKETFIKDAEYTIRKLTQFDRRNPTHDAETRALYSDSIRARLRPEETGPYAARIRCKQVLQKAAILELSDGSTTYSTSDEMLGYATEHFERYFSHREVSEEELDLLLPHLTARVPPKHFARCEQDYTEEDLWLACRKCQRHAAPGDDGLPIEFYLVTWSVAGPILTKLKNLVCSNEGLLSKSQRFSRMPLAYKRGEKDQLKNYRPLRSFNADFRIMSKCDTQRLAPCLEHIIGETQTAFTPNRSITRNVAELFRAIDDENEFPGILLSTDLMGAYDRLSHAYIERVLAWLGFGPRMIIQLMSHLKGHFAAITLNGFKGTAFATEMGAGQGAPGACPIWVIALEPLLAMIRNKVIGIKILETTARETVFADDSDVALKDWDDASSAKACYSCFEKASGSQTSKEKSFFYPLGIFRQNAPATFEGWKVKTDDFTSLGVPIGRNVDRDKLWSNKVNQVKSRLNIIPMADLPIHTRCQIVNTYGYSKLLYLDQFYPASDLTIKAIEDVALEAIWGKSAPTVSLDRLKAPFTSGGFGLIDLKRHLEGPRAQWVYRLLFDDAWKTTPYLSSIRLRLSKRLQDKPEVLPPPKTVIGRRSTSPRQYYLWPFIFFYLNSTSPHTLRVFWESLRSLPPRWTAYTHAWRALTLPKDGNLTLSYSFLTLLPNQADEVTLNSANNSDKTFQASALQLCTMKELSSLKAITRVRKAMLTKAPMVITPGWAKRYPTLTAANYQEYYSLLARLRAKIPEAVDIQHRISLYAIHPGSFNSDPATNNRTGIGTEGFCTLCGTSPKPLDFAHLLQECPTTKQIWFDSKPPFRRFPKLQNFVCPYKLKSKTKLAFQAIFVYRVWTLYRSGFGGDVQVTQKQITLTTMRIRTEHNIFCSKLKCKKAMEPPLSQNRLGV